MFLKLLGFDPAKNNLKTEIMAGITTFLTMAYILAVNPNIFSNLASQGMDTNAVFTSTALAAIVGLSELQAPPGGEYRLHQRRLRGRTSVLTTPMTLLKRTLSLTASIIESIL